VARRTRKPVAFQTCPLKRSAEWVPETDIHRA